MEASVTRNASLLPDLGIFNRVQILSLSEQLPGPFATMLLADLGADAILVERPAGGDPARAFPQLFDSMARNKRSICLDLKSSTGTAQFKKLAETADVVIEGFRPCVMERLGLDFATLEPLNSRLIYTSISGYGQSGPNRNRVAHDLSCQGVAGHLFNRNLVGNPTVPYGDLAGAMFAVFAIASALFARERTGHGTNIDVSMTDSLASWMTPSLGPELNGHRPSDLSAEPAYGVFACRDGAMLSISIAHEDHFWQALCDLLDLSDLAGLRASGRVARAAELRARIGNVLSQDSLSGWTARLDAVGIPWSPVQDLAGVARDPHFLERGLFVKLPGMESNSTYFVSQPLKFSRYQSNLKRNVPRLGEHTQELLTDAGIAP